MNEQDSKWKNSKNYLAPAVAAFGVVCAGLLVCFLLFNGKVIRGYVGLVLSSLRSVLVGLTLAYLLNPVMGRLESVLTRFVFKGDNSGKRQGRIRLCSVTLTILLMLAILFILIGFVAPQLVDTLVSLGQSIPGYVDQLSDYLNSDDQLAATLRVFLNDSSKSLTEWLNQNVLTTLRGWLLSLTGQLMGVVSGIISFMVGIIISVYVLCSKERFIGQSKKMLYAFLRPEHANTVLAITRKSNEIFGGFISGKLIDSLIIGLLCFCGTTLLRIPYAILVSVIVGVTNVIPFFGPYIGAVPTGLLILVADWKAGLVYIVFNILLQQFDGNILGPRILAQSTGLSAFWVVFSVMLFGGLFGVMGMLLGVPVFGVIYYLVKTFVEYCLRKKGLPEESGAYEKVWLISGGVAYSWEEEGGPQAFWQEQEKSQLSGRKGGEQPHRTEGKEMGSSRNKRGGQGSGKKNQGDHKE
ncbi:MAG: AI-2E family transporter [Lachnospiraceae bacterium]|nr:AI-2E family transporter [Lachnospiraceae bacterium]